MDIGTGKDLEEYTTPAGDVTYHLIDIVDPGSDYSLYRYLNEFKTAITGVKSRGRIPLLAGGSGLYVEAALKGYSLPDTPEDPGLRAILETRTAGELNDMLMAESPEVWSRTDRSSRRRVIRGIEIARSMNKQEPLNAACFPELSPLIICITLPRDELIARIDKRLDERISHGLVDEVRGLLNAGVTHERMIKLGLEYRYAAMHIAGDISLDEMTARLKTEIHRFAKRQMTWFRGMERRGFRIHWISGADAVAAESIIDSHEYMP
jgi:tRNA dimethylallyltransferase